jgi:penicillin-binding protein 2
MAPHADKFKEEARFSRRALLLGAIQGLLGSTLLGRLYYLGGYRKSDYQALSQENRMKVQFILPKRGLVQDRHGITLAGNKEIYRLMIVPDQTVKITETLQELQKHYPIPSEKIEDLIQSIRYKPKFVASPIMEGLSWQDVCRLEIFLRDFSSIYIEEGWSRHYPEPEATAHLLGYVQIPTQEDRRTNPLYRLTDFRLGKAGIEKTFDQALRGEPGFNQLEVNARGHMIRKLSAKPRVDGEKMQLSIDMKLQKYVQGRLATEQSGAVVVMQIKTGEILALNSSPSFDANLFTNGINGQDWHDLVNNPYKCLHNKTIQGIYPPGSLFKMVVALAAYESGLIPLDYQAHCSGHIEVAGHRFHCWHRAGGHGFLSFERAISESCDIYFYEIAQKIGPERIAKAAYKLGYGHLTGLEIVGERAGLVPTPAWQLQARKQKWRLGDTVNMGIGQGAMLATPLQLAVMMARLVHPEQKAVTPTLLLNNQRDFSSLETNKAFLQLIKKGMDRTVNHPSGLGYGHRIQQPGFEVGGKTATCQVRRISASERKRGVLTNEQRPWEHRDHALFAGYAPIHDPTYAVAVVIEHGGGGGRVAAPLGRDTLLKTQQLAKLAKENTA